MLNGGQAIVVASDADADAAALTTELYDLAGLWTDAENGELAPSGINENRLSFAAPLR